MTDARPMTLSLASTGLLRKARVTDAAAIQQLIRVFAERDEMLHRPLGEMASGVAHDLNNTLHAMMNAIRSIRFVFMAHTSASIIRLNGCSGIFERFFMRSC